MTAAGTMHPLHCKNEELSRQNPSCGRVVLRYGSRQFQRGAILVSPAICTAAPSAQVLDGAFFSTTKQQALPSANTVGSLLIRRGVHRRAILVSPGIHTAAASYQMLDVASFFSAREKPALASADSVRCAVLCLERTSDLPVGITTARKIALLHGRGDNSSYASAEPRYCFDNLHPGVILAPPRFQATSPSVQMLLHSFQHEHKRWNFTPVSPKTIGPSLSHGNN